MLNPNLDPEQVDAVFSQGGENWLEDFYRSRELASSEDYDDCDDSDDSDAIIFGDDDWWDEDDRY